MRKNWPFIPVIILFFLPCCLAQTPIFEDKFDDLNLAKWDKFGSPSPVVLSSAEGRTGVFDNNGDSSYDSGAVSKEIFSMQNGFTIKSDIFLQITNPSAAYALVDFGLTDSQEPNQLEYGLEWHPNDHAYIRGHFITENGDWESYGFWDNTNNYINSWHSWKVVVGSDRYVDFYLDNSLIYHSQNRISTSVLEGKKLSISGRSEDGKAYNDFISITTGSYEDLFKVTTGLYSETADLNQAILNEFGPDYRLADWNDIKVYSDDIVNWANDIGMEHNDYYFVSRDGERFISGYRHYFITRFDGIVDPGYLVHDQIGGNIITLGSWYGIQERVLAIKDNHQTISSLEISVTPSKNVAQSGEAVPLHISVTSNSLPVNANVEIKINNKIVASYTGSEYTYNFPSLFTQVSIGSYSIEATATYNGLIARDIKKIEVIGDISKPLQLASKVALNAFSEIYQSEDLATTRLTKSEIELGSEAVFYFVDTVLENYLKNNVKSILGSDYNDEIEKEIEEVAKVFEIPYNDFLNKLAERGLDITKLGSELWKWEAQLKETQRIQLENFDWASVKNNKITIENDLANFIEYIQSNPNKFSNIIGPLGIEFLFELYSRPIGNVVETTPVLLAGTEFGQTESQVASYYDQLMELGDVIVQVVFWIVIGLIIVVFIVGIIVAAAPTALAFLAAIGTYGWTAAVGIVAAGDLISKAFLITKLSLVLVLINLVPPVADQVELEHMTCIDLIKSSLESDMMPSLSNVKVADTTTGVAAQINSSGHSFVITPDGRISKLIAYNGDYVPIKAGTYKIMTYQHSGSLFSNIASTEFQVSQPQIFVNTSYALQNTVATIELQITNLESSRVENLSAVMGIKNSTEGIVYSRLDTVSLEPGESKNFTYIVDLVKEDAYSANIALLKSYVQILDEKTFSIRVGNEIAEDVAIIDINYLKEYSPLNNITLNAKLESFAPGLAFNITIPRFNYKKPIVLSGTEEINLTLPKLPPGEYLISIIAEKNGRTLDSRIIDFYVRAEGVAILTFNSTPIAYDVGIPYHINLSLKDLNLTDVDAEVHVRIIDPTSTEHDISSMKTSQGYQFTFLSIVNGTYLLEAQALKDGWRIENNSLTVIVGQMSPLKMNVTIGDYIWANVTANGQPAACNVTIYTPQGNESVITSNGLALFNATNQFYIVADKMFFEPAFYSFEPYSISGTKFNDTNSNATRDPGEAGLPGWTIRLTRPDGTTINATTDANGAYKFENLTSGIYRVSEVRQSNWTQTYPAWLGDHIINVSDGNVTGVDFGNSYLPVPEIPAGPASGIPGTEYSYSTSSTDPGGYQISYTFDWGDGTNSTTGLFDSGATASAAHIWNSSGIYQVRAMATNSKGASSGWSDPLAVSIANPIFGWKALGGVITSSPSAIIDSQDQTEIWVKGGDNALWLNIDGSWQGKGGYLTSDPFAAEDYNGRIHVLARGGDNAAWDFIYDPVSQSGEWVGLGGYITEGLTAARDPANHNLMRVAARGGDEALWTCDLDINARSSSWSFQGGVLTSRPYIIFDPSGREHILVRGGDNSLWDRNGEWTGSSYTRTWSSLGGILANSPVATIEPGADSRIAVFAKGGDDAVWMCDVDSSSEPETGSWHRLGGVISSDIFAVADTSSNKICSFARGGDMALWENVFTTTPWNPEGGQWQYHGGSILDYRPGATLTGITQAFVIGTDNSLWQNTQATASATAGDARSGESEAEKEIQSSITDQDLRELSQNKQKDAKSKLELMKDSITARQTKAKQIQETSAG